MKRSKPPVVIPQSLLNRLRVAMEERRNSNKAAIWGGVPEIDEIAKLLKLSNLDQRWNRVIDYLDLYYPDWRGYRVHYTHAELQYLNQPEQRDEAA